MSKLICSCPAHTLVRDVPWLEYVCVDCGQRYLARLRYENDELQSFRIMSWAEQQAIEDVYFDKLFGDNNRSANGNRQQITS